MSKIETTDVPVARLKILVSAFACDPKGGSEFNTGFYFALYLAMAGHDVWCVTRSRGKNNIESAEVTPPNLHFIFVDVPQSVEKLYRFTIGMYLYYLIWQRIAAHHAIRLDAHINFDLIHHITWGSIQLGSGMWRVGKPLFFGPVGGGQYSPPCFFPYFGIALFGELARWCIANILTLVSADFRQTMLNCRCVMVSNNETERLAKRNGAHNKIIFLADPAIPPSFISETYEHAAENGKPLRLLWVGRMFPRKGLGFTLEALALVPENIPWSLTIVGYGPLERASLRKVKSLGLEGRVSHIGRLSWPETQKMYLDHDALIFTPFRESVGAQLLEAMACGLPLIVLDIHGAHCFVPGGAGFKVRVTNARETAQQVAIAVAEFWHLPATQRLEMSKICRTTAQAYSWPQKINRIEELYKSHLT